jgi:hypothetical protein
VKKTALYVGDPFGDKFLSDVEELAALGVSLVDFAPTGDPVAYVERLGAEVMPRLNSIG